MNAPNLITIARLLSVPLAIWLITTGQLSLAFWLFVAAGVSDAVDGFIAKRFHLRTELGRYLDPLADKALLVGVFVVLGVQQYLPSWIVILVVARDMLLVCCTIIAVLMGAAVRIQPLLVSKLNTCAQIVLAATVLAVHGLGIGAELVEAGLIDALVWLVAATTVASGGAYLVNWTRRTQGLGDPS